MFGRGFQLLAAQLKTCNKECRGVEPLHPCVSASIGRRSQPCRLQDVWLLALTGVEGCIPLPPPSVRHNSVDSTGAGPWPDPGPHAGLKTSGGSLHPACSFLPLQGSFPPSPSPQALSSVPWHTWPWQPCPPTPQLTSLLTTLVTSSKYFSLPSSEPEPLSRKPKLSSSGERTDKMDTENRGDMGSVPAEWGRIRDSATHFLPQSSSLIFSGIGAQGQTS